MVFNTFQLGITKLVIILSMLRISNLNKDGMLSCSLRGNPRPQIEWYYNKVSLSKNILHIIGKLLRTNWVFYRSTEIKTLVHGSEIGHFTGQLKFRIRSQESCEWLHKDQEIRFLSQARPMVWNPKILMILLLYFCILITTG